MVHIKRNLFLKRKKGFSKKNLKIKSILGFWDLWTQAGEEGWSTERTQEESGRSRPGQWGNKPEDPFLGDAPSFWPHREWRGCGLEEQLSPTGERGVDLGGGGGGCVQWETYSLPALVRITHAQGKENPEILVLMFLKHQPKAGGHLLFPSSDPCHLIWTNPPPGFPSVWFGSGERRVPPPHLPHHPPHPRGPVAQCEAITSPKSLTWWAFSNEMQSPRVFPGSPVVRTPHFHCKGHGFNPWSGN